MGYGAYGPSFLFAFSTFPDSILAMGDLARTGGLTVILLLSLLVGSAVLHGDSLVAAEADAAPTGTPTAAVTKEAPDFSKAFAGVYRAGLPDVKDWQYVRFIYRAEEDEDAIENWQRMLWMGKFSGNALVEPKPGPDGLRRAIFDGITLAAITDEKNEGALEKLKRLATRNGLVLRVGSIKQASEAGDATALADGMAAWKPNDQGRQKLLDSRSQMTTILFHAAHFHRRGYVKEGHRIAGTLHALLPRKEALAEAANESLANARFQESLVAFTNTRDWRALNQSLERLIADFPRLWPMRPVANRLLAQAKKRASGRLPAPKADGAFPLTAEQKRWWMTVTENSLKGDRQSEDEPPCYYLARYWFALRSEAPLSMREPWEDVLSSDVRKMFDMGNGWDWIAVAAAGLGDHTPTNWVQTGRPASIPLDRTSPKEAPRELTEDEVDACWANMCRPITRDEIVRAFLGHLIPTKKHTDVQKLNEDDLKSEVKVWRAGLAGKTGADFARVYFQEGDEVQAEDAAAVLRVAVREEDLVPLEALALSHPQKNMATAVAILQKRKAAAGPFLEKFKAAYLAAEVREEDRDQELSNHVKGVLEALDGIVSGSGMRDVIQKYPQDGLYSAAYALGEEYRWSQAELESIFDLIARTEAKNRDGLLRMVTRAAHGMLSPRGPEPSRMPEGYPRTLNKDVMPPDWLVARYGRVIADNKDVELPEWEEHSTVGQYACYLLDSLWNEAAAERLYNSFQYLPWQDVWGVFEARAAARLAGKPLPPAPDASRVPEVRRQEFRASLEKLGEGGWAPFLAGLTMEEKLVLVQVLRDAEIQSTWEKTLMSLTGVSVRGLAAIARQEWEKSRQAWLTLAGSAVDAGTLKRVLDQCHAAWDAGTEIRGVLMSRPLYQGFSLSARDAADSSENSRSIVELFNVLSAATRGDFVAVSTLSFQSDVAGVTMGCAFGRAKDGSWQAIPSQSWGVPSGSRWRTLSLEEFVIQLRRHLANIDRQDSPVRIIFGATRMPQPGKGNQ